MVTQYDNATVGSGAATDEVKYTYDDYGNLTQLQQDRNSLVGASGSVDDQSVSWSYALAAPTGGSQMVRCTGETLPGSTSVTYSYASSGNSVDDASGRVSKVTVGAVDVATYAYLGSGQLVGTDLPESNLNTRSYSSGTANYDRVDRFGRVVTNRWADTTSDVDLYKVSLTYDRGSNITSIADAVHSGFDALYGMDNLNRLINADEGTLSGGSISTRRRQEMWTLTQTGNWSNHKLDLNGDSAYGGTDELNDTGTFNVVNELTARDKDTNATNDYTLAYDAVGNMTDDGEKYTYVYDAFGRLVTVKNRSTSAVVAEYKYNGLNQRIGSHDDTNASGTVDSSDPWYWFVQDSRWRTVATFRASSWGYSGSNDTSPKETTVYHAGGLGGGGGSSYIDSVILADKDMSNGWGGAADGTREKRVYLLQNWRADVSCVTDQAGKVLEWIKYSPYGVPFRIDPADFDRDGDVDSADSSAFTTEYNNGTPRADANHDGFIDFTDFDLYTDNYNAASAGGRNVLSRGGSASGGIHNRIGYAGYLWDSATWQYHVRNRVILPSIGRWSRRDPLGHIDGPHFYGYVRTNPLNARDDSGLYFHFTNCPVDPETQRFIDEANAACPSSCKVNVNCARACDSEEPSGTTTNSSCPDVNVCRSRGGVPRSEDEILRTLRHELIHVRQNCQFGAFPLLFSCNDRICAEYEAYDRTSTYAIDHNDPMSRSEYVCVDACFSVFNSGPSICNSDCEARCNNMVKNGMCSKGRYQRKPVNPTVAKSSIIQSGPE